MTIPPEHVRAMADLIDAQARHIEKLEAGHWSRDTRAEVDAAHYRYIGKGAPPPSAFDKGGELPAPRGIIQHTEPAGIPTPLCTFGLELDPPGAWSCTLPEGHGQNHHLVYNYDPAEGGELTTIDHGDAVPVEIHHGGPEIPRTLAEIDADVEEANKQHPTHTNNHILDGAWPPKGECARCDALEPLWDERQARLFQATRQLRAAHGDHRATPNTQCGYHAPDGWDCRLSTGHPWPHRATGPWNNEAKP